MGISEIEFNFSRDEPQEIIKREQRSKDTDAFFIFFKIKNLPKISEDFL
jgi:hypothetical protein